MIGNSGCTQKAGSLKKPRNDVALTRRLLRKICQGQRTTAMLASTRTPRDSGRVYGRDLIFPQADLILKS